MRDLLRLPAAEHSPIVLGGKGASLSRMMALGLPVPEAWVVPAEAYRRHSSSADVSSDSSKIAATLVSTPLAPELVASLQAALGGAQHAFAVRSSATLEDGAEHSFAGQFETLLGVTGAEAVGESIRKCWASAWSERAVRYREQAGVAAQAVAMAVVVQRLVRPRAAGVAFTRDPVSGSDRLVVEAVRGLGEALVSGRETPDRWLLERETYRIIDRYAVATPVLSDEEVAKVARLAALAEEKLGGPQDVEWALDEEGLWLLQARPITSLARAASGPRRAWTNTNTAELFPDVATPLSFSVIDRYVRRLIEGIFRPLGIELGGEPIAGLVHGRVYFCLNTFVAMMHGIPGLSKKNPAELFGGDPERIEQALARLRPEDFVALPKRRGRFLSGLFHFLRLALRHRDIRADDLIRTVKQHDARLAALDLASLSDKELARQLAAMDAALFIDEGLMVAAIGAGCGTGLQKLCAKWLDDSEGAMANRLLSGMGGMDSAEAGLALWRLTGPARACDLPGVLEQAEDYEQVRRALSGTAEGRAFLDAFEAYLREHGHHGRGEIDIAQPRWREVPLQVLGMIGTWLSAGTGYDAVENHRRRTAERIALEAECRRRLSWPKRWLFDALLVRAQRGFTLRENIKSEAVRALGHLRRMLLEGGRRLAATGRLEGTEHVFFLTLDELLGELEGRRVAGLEALVARRRLEHRRNLPRRPPPVVVDGEPHEEPRLEPVTGETLVGIAASPGVVEGKVRVILESDARERLEPGEILVAPHTDPGWTPYFVAASGLVVDLGGTLSHGSVVAREYGIPAVVNVRAGTRTLRTGDRVRVDGNRGIVTILR